MADPADRPAYSFTPGPPPEASRYLSAKGWQPAFSWLDVEPEEHAVAFSVAKATSMDVLRDIREALQEALDDGLPFAEFQKQLRPKLQARGWWGPGQVRDPVTDELRDGLLGTPRRLRTIYDANLRSARAAGQWERIQRTKDALPYLQYRLGPSENHRHHHETKDGLTLPADDPFWSSWMPPNGWGCKCWVRQLTRAQAERTGIDTAPDIPDRQWTNSRTGEVKRIPRGIDPGWERNPGQMRRDAMADLTREKLAALPAQSARVAARDMATSWRALRILRGDAPGRVPVGVLPDDIASAVSARRGVVELTAEDAARWAAAGRDVTTDALGALADALHDGQVARELVDGVQRLTVISRDPDAPRLFTLAASGGDQIVLTGVAAARAGDWFAVLTRDGVDVLRP